jgi:uncharacterized protein YjbI with pentapeptide repeats
MNPNSQRLAQLEDIVEETAPVAMIRQDPAEINGLDFKESYDDLDYLSYAILPLSSECRVGLVRHKHSPVSGIEICVRYDQPNVPRVLSETLKKMNLNLDDFIWIHPDHEKQLNELIKKQSEHKKYLCKHIKWPDYSTFNTLEHLSGHDLSRLKLKEVQLQHSNLQKTKFRDAELGFACFQYADLKEADLSRADLRKADFQRANLEGADLSGADLREANLQRANLNGADLSGADLRRVNLKDSNLTLAHLSNATVLENADVGHATLTDVKWHEDTMWLNVVGLHTVIEPPHALKQHTNFKYGIELSKGIEELFEYNNLEKFREIYKRVLSDIKEDNISASLWNKLAWLSCLYGYPYDEPYNEAYEAALKAVSLAKDKGNYYDTLGLILALRGDYNSAINNFKTALKHKDIQNWLPSLIDNRKSWIQSLQLGTDPFTEGVMEVLRIEER